MDFQKQAQGQLYLPGYYILDISSVMDKRRAHLLQECHKIQYYSEDKRRI
jgi:hypothetical protein